MKILNFLNQFTISYLYEEFQLQNLFLGAPVPAKMRIKKYVNISHRYLCETKTLYWILIRNRCHCCILNRKITKLFRHESKRHCQKVRRNLIPKSFLQSVFLAKLKFSPNLNVEVVKYFRKSIQIWVILRIFARFLANFVKIFVRLKKSKLWKKIVKLLWNRRKISRNAGIKWNFWFKFNRVCNTVTSNFETCWLFSYFEPFFWLTFFFFFRRRIWNCFCPQDAASRWNLV